MLLAIFLALAAPAAAAPGDLDRSFADGGRTAYQRQYGGYVAGLALPDGRRPLLSIGTYADGLPSGQLLTLTAGGRLASGTAFPVVRPARFADGYALTQTGSAPTRYSLGRIGEPAAVTLTLPPATGEPGALAPEASSFGVDAAGRVLLNATSYRAGRFRSFVIRYLPDGTPDATYGRGGSVELPALSGTSLVRPDGRLYTLSWLRGGGGLRVQAFDAAGRPLAGFISRPRRTGRFRGLEEPHLIASSPGGRLLVAGGDVYRSGWILRLRADGSLDERFGDRGLRVLRRFSPDALVRDRRGRIVLAGLRQSKQYGHAGVARLSANGNLDRRFGIVAKRLGKLRGVRFAASAARHVAIDDRGRIVIAGEAYDDDYGIRDDLGRSYPAVARLLG